MKLSVIVPTLDGRVPQSLRSQVAGHADVELVVVTGVSPVGKARNEGLRRATGEWIAWVDSDDEVCDDWLKMIETTIAEAEDGVDAILFDALSVGWKALGDLVYGKSDGNHVIEDLYEEEILHGHLWRTVTRRVLWKSLLFDETIRRNEDFLLLPQVLARARKIAYLPKALYRYVWHSGSATNAVDVWRQAEAIGTVIRRWRETPPEYRACSLHGSMKGVYEILMALNVDPGSRKVLASDSKSRQECAAAIRSGYAFLRRHFFEASFSGRERLRLLCACFGFWWPQRLVHWRKMI